MNMTLITNFLEGLAKNGPNFLLLIITAILIPIIASDWMVYRGQIRSNHSRTLNKTTNELNQNLNNYFGLYPTYEKFEWKIHATPEEDLPFHEYYLSHLKTGYPDIFQLYITIREKHGQIAGSKLNIVNKLDEMIKTESNDFGLDYTYDRNMANRNPQINVRIMIDSLLQLIENNYRESETYFRIITSAQHVFNEQINTDQTGGGIKIEPGSWFVLTLEHSKALEIQDKLVGIKNNTELNEEIKQYVEDTKQLEPMKNKLSKSLDEIDQEVVLRETLKGKCKHCPPGILSAIANRIKNVI
jgi:hypothetical protein